MACTALDVISCQASTCANLAAAISGFLILLIMALKFGSETPEQAQDQNVQHVHFHASVPAQTYVKAVDQLL